MKKFFTFIAAVLFAGGMMAEGLLFEQTYPGTPSSKTNAYDASFTLATDGYTLTYANVNNGSKNDSWDVVRAGRKSAASVATVTSEAIAAKVSKVVIDFTQVDASKTNELCLLVANNAAFTNATKVNATIAKGEVSFTVAAPAENMYYQISMDMVAHGSSNGFNRWNKIQFITPEGGTPIVAPTYDTLTVAQAKEIAQALADKATSKEKYYVEGYAVNVEAYSLQFGNQNFYMVDDVKAPDNSFEAYAAYPTKNGKAYPVLAGDKVRAFGALKKYGTQLEIDHPTVEFITEVEGDRTIEQPAEAEVITVTKALEIGTALESGKTTTEYYEVQGYVTALTDNKGVANADGGWAAYKNQCMWIADAKDGGTAKETAFFVYQGVASEQVTKGAKISIKCQIKNYNGMVENAAAKAAVTILEKGEEPTPVDPTPTTLDTITVAKALEIGAALDVSKTSDDVYVIAGYVSKIVTPYDSVSQNETFWMVDEKGGRAATNAEGAFEVYRGKMDTIAERDAKVYVTAKIYKYQPMKNNQPNGDPLIETANNPIPAVHVAEAGAPEVIEAITVARALEIGQQLQESDKDHSYPSVDLYEITGYVSYIEEAYSSFGNETFWITDTKGERTNDKTKAFEVYRGKPDTQKEIGMDAKIKIVCYIKNFKGTIENDGNNIPFEVLEQGTELTYDTISVKEALAEIAKLEDGATTLDKYVVKGYIAEVTGAYDPNFKNMNITMTDKFNRLEGDLTAFRAKIAEADVEKAVSGAYVYVFGTLQKHSNGPQIAQGGQITIVEAPKVDTVAITVAQAIEIASSLEKGEEADVFYAVTGYVAENIESGEGTQSFWMSDSETETKGDLYIDNVKIAAQAADHQQVCVYGWVGKDTEGDARILNGEAVIMSGEGIEQIVLTEKAQKVVVDGAIYIIRDNKLYNLQGAQVR